MSVATSSPCRLCDKVTMPNPSIAPGTIDQLPSGRWRVRIRLADGTRRPATFATLEEAQSFCRGTVAVLQGSGGERTLCAWGQRWLERRELAGLRNIAPA